MTGQLFTVAEAAQLLRVTESWLRAKAVKRQIPFHLIARKYRFTQADLDQILADTAKTPGRVPPTRLRVAGRPASPARPSAGRPARGRAS